jgi:hypothetical protein
MQIIYNRCQPISTDYFLLCDFEYDRLTLISGNFKRDIGDVGNYLVFGIQPGTQINILAPPGAKGKEFLFSELALV